MYSPKCVPNDPLDDEWLSDKAHFVLSDHINSKNKITWRTAPPEDVPQRPLHSITMHNVGGHFETRHHRSILDRESNQTIYHGDDRALNSGA